MAVDILKSQSSPGVGRAGDRGGVCRFCGCTERDACLVDDLVDVRGCSWIDQGRRVCSVCAPAAKAEGQSLRGARRVGYLVTPAWVRAHHLGFVVGWFTVSPRSRYGRNPFRPRVVHEAWTIGQRVGAESARVFQIRFGEITNEPRKAALLAGMPRGRRAGA